MKWCSGCRTLKAEKDFYADRTRKDGLYPHCRSCASAAKKASRQRRTEEQRRNDRETIARWRKENPESNALIERRAWLKKKYGISVEEFDALLKKQRGRCAICRTKPNGKSLVVDHCHNSKRVRGLLCSNCNVGLGHFRHDKKLLQGAINYL